MAGKIWVCLILCPYSQGMPGSLEKGWRDGMWPLQASVAVGKDDQMDVQDFSRTHWTRRAGRRALMQSSHTRIGSPWALTSIDTVQRTQERKARLCADHLGQRASDFFSARSSLLSGDNSIHSAVKTAWHDICEGSLWATEWSTVTGSISQEFSYTFNRWLYWLLITQGSGKLLFCCRTPALSSSMPLKIQNIKYQPSGTIIICDFRSHNSVLQWMPCVNCVLYGHLSYPDLDCKLSATSFSSVFTTLFFTGAVGLEWGDLISFSANPLIQGIDTIISFA